MPPSWRPQLLRSGEAVLDVVGGFHCRLAEVPEPGAAERRRGMALIEVRCRRQALARHDPSRTNVADCREIALPALGLADTEREVGVPGLEPMQMPLDAILDRVLAE